MDHGFTWLGSIPYIGHLPNHSVSATLVTVLILSLALIFRRYYSSSSTNIFPEAKISIINILETAGEFVANLLDDIIGKNGRKFLPIIGTTFLFIFCSNALGLIPGFLPPTDNVNTNAACALFIFLAYNFFGIKEHGIGYLKQFTGPFWWLAVLFIPIEIISHLARPFSLTLRLFGNIMGDHTVLNIFSDLVPIGVPIIFIGLGLFVSFIQAFVFSILSVLYINLAISHDH